jgi:hypothetical protein
VLDPQTGKEEHRACINTVQNSGLGALRSDPHPAWDLTWNYIALMRT